MDPPPPKAPKSQHDLDINEEQPLSEDSEFIQSLVSPGVHPDLVGDLLQWHGLDSLPWSYTMPTVDFSMPEPDPFKHSPFSIDSTVTGSEFSEVVEPHLSVEHISTGQEQNENTHQLMELCTTEPVQPSEPGSCTYDHEKYSTTSSPHTDITEPSPGADINDPIGMAQTTHLDPVLNADAYYGKLDMLEVQTAEICGIDQGPYAPTESPEECFRVLVKCREALRSLQAEGFCGETMSLLVEDESRWDVAKIVHLSLQELIPLISWPNNIETTLSRALPILFGDSFLETWCAIPLAENLPWLQFLSKMLPIALVSFSGSHVCPFGLNLWDQESEEIPVGQGYTFKQRPLACLEGFIGGPAWVLGKDKIHAHDTGLKLSLLMEDIQELWGPVWLVGGTPEAGRIIRTEGGYIVPLERASQTDPSLEEIDCHWTKEIPEYIKNDDPILLSSTSRLLVGTSSSNTFDTPGLTLNLMCETPISCLQQRVANNYRLPGTCEEYYSMEGYEVQLGVSQYGAANMTLVNKRHRRKSMKETILKQYANMKIDEEKFRGILELRIGLEVSACTGNAQRVTLWDALRLSHALPNSPQYLNCTHAVADPECIQTCWDRYQGADGLKDTKLNDVDARRIIVESIHALQDTGIDRKGNLQAYGPS